MKGLYYVFLCFLSITVSVGYGQDFSNKGKDFWVGYGYHQVMRSGNQQQMVLYFATDAITTVTVEIPGLGYSETYTNIAANTIFTSNPLPKTGSQDARLTQEGTFNNGIHITSSKPIVAYTHIYNSSVSGATLLFPTPTLGREYYSVNFTQTSNAPDANCWVYAIAVDTGTTTIEVIPSANTVSHVANLPFTVNLQQGEILNLMGELITRNDPYKGEDLTGTSIKSVGSGTGGCKRIAVFSGSGRISVTCNNFSSSSDNYIVQAFPKNAWGKKYLTVPTSNLTNNFFRICVSDPTTVVTFNGVPLSGLINNFYYQLTTNQPGLIESDKPVMVSQVITSQGACANGNPGDPELIYLSPIEQNIDKVILNSTSNFGITQHWINVVIKTTGIASFKIDGISFSSFTSHPRDANYSYAQISVSAGQHSLSSDSGFNAIAYGYGNAESYGYNAGTNVKDLYQFVSIQNQFSTVNFPSTCRNTPFLLSMTFPYQPTQVKWVFGTALNTLGINDTTVNNPVFDSTWIVNGKQLYRYPLPGAYTISAAGTYPIRIFAQNPSPDGCTGEQEINYDVQVFERPVADFSFTTSGCISDSVRFTDISNTGGRTSTKWVWNFDDGQSSQIRNPAHLFSAGGTYNVRHAVVTDIGCISDTVIKPIIISEPPVAKFGISAPNCIGKTITLTDASTIATSTIIKWTWNFGDGSPAVVATTNVAQTHIYANSGTFTITLQVENASGCKSLVYARPVTIFPNPTVNFNFGKACLPTGLMQFTDASTISNGTQNSFTYLWNFGDGGGTSSLKDPSHNYSAVGPYQVSLVVTSGAGCIDSTRKVVDSIYAQPQAAFNAPAGVCFGTIVNFTDQSTAPNSSTTTWLWDFGDGTPPSSQVSPTHNYSVPGSYVVSLTTTSAVGCVSGINTKPVVMNALPTADFTPSVPRCVSRTVSFTNTSSPNSGLLTKYLWNFGDGTPTSNQLSPIHTYISVGSYNVSLQVETDQGCVSTVISKPVVMSPLPLPGFVMPGNCINDPISQFIDTSSIADGTEGLFTYLWDFGDVNSNAGNPNTSTQKNGTHKFTATGNYSVTLTVTSGNGCSSSGSQVFTINGAVPVSEFVVQGGLQHCSNDSVRITDNSSVSPGKLIQLEIYWDFAGDPTNKTVINNPIPGASYSHLYPAFFTPASRVYVINMVAYSGINCLSSLPQTVTLNATPDITFAAMAPVCSNEASFQIPVSVSNMTAGNGVFSGNGVSSGGIFNPSTGAGNYNIRYTYTTTTGCINFKEQSIRVSPVPIVNAGPDKFVLEGGSATLNGSPSGNNLTYLWVPNIYLNNPAVAQPMSTPVADITYTLIVKSLAGCSDSDQVFVKLLKSPTIPNVFTPNGDGVNDTWVIQYLESYPGATVELFNRYGSLVFRSVGYTKAWDGTYGGKQMPAGTYYYIINPKNGRKQISGFVDIVR